MNYQSPVRSAIRLNHRDYSEFYLFTPAERLSNRPKSSEIVTKRLQKYVRDEVGEERGGVYEKYPHPSTERSFMEKFDYHNMSKITYPASTNEMMYLRFTPDGRCEASDKGRECVLYNYGAADCVGVLNAKLHPVNRPLAKIRCSVKIGV